MCAVVSLVMCCWGFGFCLAGKRDGTNSRAATPYQAKAEACCREQYIGPSLTNSNSPTDSHAKRFGHRGDLAVKATRLSEPSCEMINIGVPAPFGELMLSKQCGVCIPCLSSLLLCEVLSWKKHIQLLILNRNIKLTVAEYTLVVVFLKYGLQVLKSSRYSW